MCHVFHQPNTAKGLGILCMRPYKIIIKQTPTIVNEKYSIINLHTYSDFSYKLILPIF